MASLPASAPALGHKCRLTACRSVSCYGRFSRPNRARGEGPVKMAAAGG
jgi:hypothetical protein